MSDDKLPISDHLIELRKRITRSVLAMVITTAVAFVFHEQLLEFLMRPAQGFSQVPNNKPIYTELTEFIGVAFKVSMLAGFVLAFPYVLYQIVMFIAPGLKPNERRYLYILLPGSMLAFAAGAAFGYRVLFPPVVNFLLTFGADVATPYIRIGNYTSLMLTLLFWMGIVFEMPVLAYFLSKIGVLTPQFLSKRRRYGLVLAFVLGAIITPTFDPINQTLVAVPILVMYELSIWLAKFGARGRTAPASELNLDADG